MKDLEPEIRNIWMFKSVLIVFVITLFLIFIPYDLSFLPYLFFVLGSILGLIYQFKRYQKWGFEVRDDHLYIERGVLIKTYTMVPFVRIQHIDTSRGVLDRAFGLSSLIVYTAGSRSADVVVPGLTADYAESLQKDLRDIAIETDEEYGDAV